MDGDILVSPDTCPRCGQPLTFDLRRRGGWRCPQHGGLADRSLVCEEHPGLPWPHDDCAGPGMLRGDVEREG